MIKLAQKNFGFTIIELAVVVTIISFTLGSALTIAALNRDIAKIELTTERIEYIMEMVENFVDEKGYLPCPTDPTLAFSNANFGIGLQSGNPLIAVTTCTSGNIITSTSGNIKLGAVPVYTLNISPEYILDGWNRRILYAVDQDLTFVGTDGTNGYIDDTNPTIGGIEIQNAAGVVTAALGIPDAAFLVMSAGPNGHGSWPGRGSGTRINASIAEATKEGENSHVGGTFDHQFIQSLPLADYDDIVYFKTKWQLNGAENTE